jgi:hypothetical protein
VTTACPDVPRHAADAAGPLVAGGGPGGSG